MSRLWPWRSIRRARALSTPTPHVSRREIVPGVPDEVCREQRVARNGTGALSRNGVLPRDGPRAAGWLFVELPASSTVLSGVVAKLVQFIGSCDLGGLKKCVLFS